METCIEHIKHLNIAKYLLCELAEVIGLRKLYYGWILFLHHATFISFTVNSCLLFKVTLDELSIFSSSRQKFSFK